jgi:hypothetical protein
MTVLNSTFVLSSRTPTATGGIDFLDRLRIAERNDGSRSSRLRWHPNVVDRVESAWDVERTCVDDSQITPYSEPEIQEAYGRQMVKTHIRQCLRKADPETRTRYNAVSADEAWRRADALRMELEQAGRSSNDEQSLKQRQREAALRCQEQAMGKAPAGIASASAAPVVTSSTPAVAAAVGRPAAVATSSQWQGFDACDGSAPARWRLDICIRLRCELHTRHHDPGTGRKLTERVELIIIGLSAGRVRAWGQRLSQH